MTQTRWLVLGLGNALSGADGFGPAVAAQLSGRNLPPGVEVCDANTDLLAHVDRFPSYDHVVLVDTVIGEGSGIAVVEEETFGRWDDRSRTAHELSPLRAVKLFRALQPPAPGHPPPAPTITLVAHIVSESAFSTPPSPAIVRAGASAVLQLVTLTNSPPEKGTLTNSRLNW